MKINFENHYNYISAFPPHFIDRVVHISDKFLVILSYNAQM